MSGISLNGFVYFKRHRLMFYMKHDYKIPNNSVTVKFISLYDILYKIFFSMCIFKVVHLLFHRKFPIVEL